MRDISCDVAVIGAGPAGLAAAAAAKEQCGGRVLVIERDSALGGILQQCIHPGFGLTYYREELTGPEYAGRFISEVNRLGVETLLDTMVLDVQPSGHVVCASCASGMIRVAAKSVVLAMGCRERTRGNIRIPGTRPAGVYTAGTAQRLINRQNEMVGSRVVILGSGDVGMIMARRLTLEGTKVVAVVELLDYLAGLTRNRVQCLDDFDIPLMLSHTVTGIVGEERVSGVFVAQVGKDGRPIADTRRLFSCDTLLLSVGLIPENELSRAANVGISPVTNGPIVNQYMQTSVPALFACGNVVHVNDLADNVSKESGVAGRCAALFAAGRLPAGRGDLTCRPGANVRYICPQNIALSETGQDVSLHFRVSRPDTQVRIRVTSGGRELLSRKAVKVNPGEMQHVDVSTAGLPPGELVINVEGGTGND